MMPFYEVSPNFQIEPSDITIIHNSRELYFNAHMHSYVEILYVFDGVQHVNIDNVSYEVKEGEAAIMFPDTVHNYYKADKKWADGLLVICNPKIWGNVIPCLTNMKPFSPVIQKGNIHPDVVYAFNRISHETELSTRVGWSYIIISQLLKQLEIKNLQNMPIVDITHKIIEYVGKNFTDSITLEILAKELHVSKYYVSHIFSNKIRMNFRSYIGLLRLEYAVKLIRTTNDSLTNISNNSGFESQRTFNRIFKTVYGISPMEYRKNINQYLNV